MTRASQPPPPPGHHHGRCGHHPFAPQEPQLIVVNAVLFIIAILVAISRFGPYSY
jgi:hypothetical protein